MINANAFNLVLILLYAKLVQLKYLLRGAANTYLQALSMCYKPRESFIPFPYLR